MTGKQGKRTAKCAIRGPTTVTKSSYTPVSKKKCIGLFEITRKVKEAFKTSNGSPIELEKEILKYTNKDQKRRFYDVINTLQGSGLVEFAEERNNKKLYSLTTSTDSSIKLKQKSLRDLTSVEDLHKEEEKLELMIADIKDKILSHSMIKCFPLDQVLNAFPSGQSCIVIQAPFESTLDFSQSDDSPQSQIHVKSKCPIDFLYHPGKLGELSDDENNDSDSCCDYQSYQEPTQQQYEQPLEYTHPLEYTPLEC